MICSNCVTRSAKMMRRTRAAMTPRMMTLRRCSAGSPAASAPTTMALSPASTRSIISTCRNAEKAAGSVMLEKSRTIEAHISAGPPNPAGAAWTAASSISIIRKIPLFVLVRKAGWRLLVPPLLVHAREEVLVRLGVLHLVEQELHGVDRAHLHQDPAQHPHLGQSCLVDQQLFLAGTRLADVERREDALVADLTVEHDFAVSGALELLEDDFVHLRASID